MFNQIEGLSLGDPVLPHWLEMFFVILRNEFSVDAHAILCLCFLLMLLERYYIVIFRSETQVERFLSSINNIHANISVEKDVTLNYHFLIWQMKGLIINFLQTLSTNQPFLNSDKVYFNFYLSHIKWLPPPLFILE